jgi:hypothetical protein
MYATCLFCSASLGTNEAIESFPVGGRIAFDAWKGRLWAVCGRCGRWNLAPIEERWEAIESAERLFADTRARVQSENIGICRAPDGTRLVRVGKALPGELAAWRYGRQLISRRRQQFATIGGAALLGGTVVAGLPLIAGAMVPAALLHIGVQVHMRLHVRRQRERIVHRLGADASPTGSELMIRRRHLYDAVLSATSSGEISVRLPTPQTMHAWKRPAAGWQAPGAEPLLIAGADAQRLLARAMSDYNYGGAKRQEVDRALSAIEEAGGADAFARKAARSGAAITRPDRMGGRRSQGYSLRQIAGTFRGEILPVEKYRDPFNMDNRPHLEKIQALALEMALNEESERTALEGELAALEAAWREAEEIAHIADALPDDAPAFNSRKRA